MKPLIVKKPVKWLLQTVAPRVQMEAAQDWLIAKLCPWTLDDRLIPKQVTPRRLWKLRHRVLCDPYSFIHRRPYWFGRLHEIHIDNYLRQTLSPGDTFIDVGANWGQLTVLAAALVGPEGRVLAFEPNRRWAGIVESFLKDEGLRQATIYPVGLGTTATVTRIHGSTLAESGKHEHEDRSQSTECEIAVGDDVIQPHDLKGKVLLKVDVEGFELHVLRGMPRTLRAVDRAIIEVTPRWIGGRAGVEEMFALMGDAGLQPFELLHTGKVGGAVDPGRIDDQIDVLFLRGR